MDLVWLKILVWVDEFAKKNNKRPKCNRFLKSRVVNPYILHVSCCVSVQYKSNCNYFLFLCDMLLLCIISGIALWHAECCVVFHCSSLAFVCQVFSILFLFGLRCSVQYVCCVMICSSLFLFYILHCCAILCCVCCSFVLFFSVCSVCLLVTNVFLCLFIAMVHSV